MGMLRQSFNHSLFPARVVGYFEVSRRIVLTTPSNPAMKRATRLSLAPSSPLPRGAKNAAAIRKMLKARKNRLANVCTALFVTLPLRRTATEYPKMWKAVMRSWLMLSGHFTQKPHRLATPIFGNSTVTTRTLLDCPEVARYLVSWGTFS